MGGQEEDLGDYDSLISFILSDMSMQNIYICHSWAVGGGGEGTHYIL